jgi:DNA-binding transcriptional LysR family regulator
MRTTMNEEPAASQNAAFAKRSERFVRGYLKTKHLVLLVELGKHGSIGHAARAANLTQPAASKLLGELEHAVGAPLFERFPRGVEPTWYGKVLIRRAGASLAEMSAAYEELMEIQSGLRGRVAVGAVLTPSTTLLPDAVSLLRSRNQHVSINIEVDGSKRLVENLRRGHLDLVIGRIDDVATAAELHFEPVTDEPHSLIGRANHPLLAHPALQLKDLLSATWIVPPDGSILHDRIAALFLSQGLKNPEETVTTSALPAVVALLMTSDMVAPMSVELVQPYLDNGLLAVLPIDLHLRMDVYGIITRRQHQLPPVPEAMLWALREAAALRAGGQIRAGVR